MDYHQISFIIMMTTFLSYVLFIWIKYGIQPSISDSYYVLPNKLKPLFTLFCWGFALPAIILGVEITPFMFFAGVGICFVGAAAQFKDDWVSNIHMIAAIGGIIFSQLAIFFGFHMLWLNIISIVLSVIMPFITIKYYFWYVELIAFSAICYALGTTIF